MPATTRPGPRTPVWTELSAHAARLAAVPVQELFERDPKRFERLSREQAGLLMDFSRQRLDEIALAKLFQLADAISLRARIDAMWQGVHINTSEDRAVLHVALRQPRGAGVGGAATRSPPGGGVTAAAASSACPKSATRSSRSSSPTEQRSRPGAIPAAARSASDSCRWVVEGG